MKNRPEKGKKVIITNTGACYTTHYPMAILLGLKRYLKSGAGSNSVKGGEIYTVIRVRKKRDMYFVGLEDELGKQVIMGHEGIQYLDTPNHNDRFGKRLEEGDIVLLPLNIDSRPVLMEGTVTSLLKDSVVITCGKYQGITRYGKDLIKFTGSF